MLIFAHVTTNKMASRILTQRKSESLLANIKVDFWFANFSYLAQCNFESPIVDICLPSFVLLTDAVVLHYASNLYGWMTLCSSNSKILHSLSCLCQFSNEQSLYNNSSLKKQSHCSLAVVNKQAHVFDQTIIWWAPPLILPIPILTLISTIIPL